MDPSPWPEHLLAAMLSSETCVSAEMALCAILDQMPVFLWTTDSNLRITSSWGSGTQLAKVKPRELMGRNACDLLNRRELHPASREHFAIWRSRDILLALNSG